MAQGRWGRVAWGDLVFGPGSQYGVNSVSGIDDMPPIVNQDVPRTDQHGEYTGPDWAGARTVQIGLALVGADPDDLRDLTVALRAATQPQRQPAALQFIDQGFLVYGKVRKRAIPYDAEYLWRLGTAALEFYCADPYLYGLNEHAVSTTAYAPSSGRTYPLTYPRAYGASGTTGRVTAVNAGATEAYPVLRIDGPVDTPAVEQTTTGTAIVLDAALQAGEYVLIDTRTRSVLLGGSTPRRDWVRGGSTWPTLQPGSNEIAYRGNSLPGMSAQQSLLTVTWRDTTL